jgi:hypothetical protein
MKEMDLEGASLPDVFANFYLYYLTSGKVRNASIDSSTKLFFGLSMLLFRKNASEITHFKAISDLSFR